MRLNRRALSLRGRVLLLRCLRSWLTLLLLRHLLRGRRTVLLLWRTLLLSHLLRGGHRVLLLTCGLLRNSALLLGCTLLRRGLELLSGRL